MNYYTEIKEILINNEINKRVKEYSKNKVELESYYNVGKILNEAGKHYGEGIIKKYSTKLTKELGKGYSQRNLRTMRQLYKIFNISNWQTLSAKLTFSHYCEIIWFEDINKINYYIKIIERENLSVRNLRQRIKSNEYERLPEETKQKIKEEKELTIIDEIKNPILINNKANINVNEIKEKTLQRLILDDLNNFLSQLGSGYAFIGSEYKILIGDTYNYIDLFLYNVKYHCYVVVELKVTSLKKEHIGHIEVYMNYIDYNLKGINDNKTIGLIVVKEGNNYVIKYSSDKRIIAREYSLEG